MTDGEADRARLRHLHHCRQFHCFAREAHSFIYFVIPEDHPQGPAHGVKLEIEEELSSHLIYLFTARPLLAEKAQGTTTLTLFCICREPALHEDLCCHLCAEYNKHRSG
ncbi:E3 12.5K protein [Simian adenovirus A1296]|uniref:E3 12.5K n=10 Tax=Simian mastadenovirus B TaxID=1962299 RepID=F2WTP7_9ADEN|nr:E3 12.5K [Simian adenovirus 49]YP_009174957.1 12.5K [Simian adenovirus 8]ADZ39882.1 E3 12.5K [Simian adenovirus 50]AFD21919.1 E3 12.5K protein [Simian adenovirus A1163]AFD21952.1 E3 12.5K protein [Simian adenovirus A1173]AFD22017.1 E3 12.5K protein [Simian adenovirus A1285]AFD22050.1 E3 12.5K protein [Simian adenovirus A1296]AFD22082.1 E3 12.5k protein [Simian adenovirus A1312]AFD22115.1 E3 12.5K protein [Simian adenovirus A1327]AFD22148.1 E3 12.5K protein [Simian adenovirus A1335]